MRNRNLDERHPLKGPTDEIIRHHSVLVLFPPSSLASSFTAIAACILADASINAGSIHRPVAAVRIAARPWPTAKRRWWLSSTQQRNHGAPGGRHWTLPEEEDEGEFSNRVWVARKHHCGRRGWNCGRGWILPQIGFGWGFEAELREGGSMFARDGCTRDSWPAVHYTGQWSVLGHDGEVFRSGRGFETEAGATRFALPGWICCGLVWIAMVWFGL